MGKKRDARASTGTDLIEARVLREQEWAFAAWMQRLPFAAMRARANASPEDGGLGYDLSVSALKGLVLQARHSHGDLNMGREERIERRQYELDETARMLRRQIARANELDTIDVHAIKLLLEVGKEEAALHGLNAATKIEADVVTRDAATEELAAMLAEAGIEQREDA